MQGWMDGWMDGQVDGWLDVCMDGWMDGSHFGCQSEVMTTRICQFYRGRTNDSMNLASCVQ